jgi:ubiquinone/menaquinone biosynthesis C-methylase UbiE
MLQDHVNQEHEHGIKAFYDGLAARDVPDHVKSGYVENHFAVRARRMRQCFDSVCQLIEGREDRCAPLKVLDVGCGNGAMTDFVLNANLDRHGVDFSAGLIEQAANRYPKIKFSVGNCYELPFPDQSFDLVVSFGLLQVVSDGRRLIHELVRVVRRKGMGLIEFGPKLSLLDIAARVPVNLARANWFEVRRLIMEPFSVQTVNGRQPSVRYRPSEVMAALRSCGVASTSNLSRRYLFFTDQDGGMVSFVS